ncbi:MAG: hypothetical protein AAGA66_00125 [Bacteroidota bacterium]
MNDISEFDQFLVDLDSKIEENPYAKYRIILGELRKIDCPYLKRKVKSAYLD